MHTDAGYTRRHPHRLNAAHYTIPVQPVGFVLCSKSQRPILTMRSAPSLLAEAIERNAANNGVDVMAWCVMPDHLHIVAQVGRDGGDLLRFLNGLKTRTGRTLRQAGLPGPIWLRSFWDRHLRPEEPLADLVSYVVHNPVNAGLCASWSEWPYTRVPGDPATYGL